MSHSESLAGAGGAKQNLALPAVLQPFHKGCNGFRLVPFGNVFGFNLEFSHGFHLQFLYYN